MTEIETLEIKEIMKEAFSEVIINNKDLIYNTFIEALEDIHFLELIKEGESTGTATREEVFAILES